MGGDNRFADGKPDSHALVAVRAAFGTIAGAVKNRFQPVGRNTHAVIPHMKGDLLFTADDGELHRKLTAGMDNGVFQKIYDNLFNEHGVHGYHQKFLWHLYLHVRIRKSFVKAGDCLRNNFLHGFHGGCDFHGILIDSGDGQKIFHHIEKPVGILADMADQLQLFRLVKLCVVVDISGAVADNAGEGRAQIMGNGAEQIGPHFFLFRVHQKLFMLHKGVGLFLNPGGHGAYYQGNHQGEHKGYGISGKREIHLEIRVGKQVIDSNHAD